MFYLTKLTETFDTTIQFCKDTGLLPNSVNCPNCNKELVKNLCLEQKLKILTLGTFVTKNNLGQQQKTIQFLFKTGTWFAGSHMPLQKSLFLTYSFVCQLGRLH